MYNPPSGLPASGLLGAQRPKAWLAALSVVSALTSACGAPAQSSTSSSTTPSTTPSTSPATGPAERDGVTVTELADGVWLHTSYKSLPRYGLIPSNGLLVETDAGLFLVDTAWTVEQTRELYQWVRRERSSTIVGAIVTHAHDDKMGGIEALHELGIPTHALGLTNDLAGSRGLHPAQHALPFDDGVETLADGALEAFFPGGGHTADNIVVYVRAADVLFGGCLIRPGQSKSLGNTADADIEHWDAAVASLQARYGAPRIVVPSHGPPRGQELLDHTIALVREYRAKRDGQ